MVPPSLLSSLSLLSPFTIHFFFNRGTLKLDFPEESTEAILDTLEFSVDDDELTASILILISEAKGRFDALSSSLSK